MYVYLFAPVLFMVAVVIGWGPRRIPARAFGWFAAAAIALAIGEYFTGFFPSINVRFWIFLILFVAGLRLVRLILSRSANVFARNRKLSLTVIAVLAFVALTIFSFGGIFVIAFALWAFFQSGKRRTGPRPVGKPTGFAANLESMRAAMERLGPLSALLLGTAIAAFAAALSQSALTNLAAAATYQQQAGLVQARQTTGLPPIQVADVPIVEQANAAIVLSNTIGGLGPQYHVSTRGLSLVRYQGRLVWTAPLDYNNGLIWLTKRQTPGYVWTSARNPNAKPQLITTTPLSITMDAGFGQNLGRVLYQHFPTLIIGTSDWELAPSGHPYWVTSLYAPAPGLASLVTRVIVGSALTDPVTGQVKFYPLGKQPSWISQVVGPNFAQSEALRYGWDRAGLIAATFTHQLTTRPVHATPYNVLLGNGGLGWEIPMTSPNSTDNSLAGLLLVDAETNRVTYTPFTGVQNDLAVSQRIDGATLNSTLSAGRALLYNVGGALAYIAPVVNQSGIIQQVAIADPKNTVQPIIASNMSAAVAEWQSYLVGNGKGSSGLLASSFGKATGIVSRVGTILQSSGASGATVQEFWLYLINGVAYRAGLSLAPNVVPFIRPGDRVTVTFVKGSPQPVTVQSITDLSLSGH